MSISNLTKPNSFDLYSKSLITDEIQTDSIDAKPLGQLEIGTINAIKIDIGGPLTPVFINGQPYIPGIDEPVIPQSVAYFTGNESSTLNDCSIFVSGINNNGLSFDSTGEITCNNYYGSTTVVNIGGPLDQEIYMGTELSTNTLMIGHEGLTVSISDGIATNYVRTGDIDRNGTLDPINIGGIHASEVNLGRSTRNVNIVNGATLITNAIDSSNPASLFINSPFVSMGGTGGTVQFNGGINFSNSGPSQLDYYDYDQQFVVTGSGPFAATTIGTYALQRIGNFVYFTITWNVSPIIVTSSSTLSIEPVIPTQFCPTTESKTFGCAVRTNGISYIFGNITIHTSGKMEISPSTGAWPLASQCDFGSISCNWNVLL